MLIFALVGGQEQIRRKVARQFSHYIGANGLLFTMPIGMDDQARLALLQQKFNPAGAISRVLVLNNLVSLAEFDWVRSVGGYVVHVDGIMPSSVVPMQKQDFFVTVMKEGRGRFDCVEDCFAAIKLRYQQDARRRNAKTATTAQV